MRTAQLGVVASLGFGVFAQRSVWDIKRQPWGSSTEQWSEAGQWSEQWKWTANQQLPAAPGSAWQFSQSNTVAPPLPAGASSSGKWTWIPSPASGGFYWSYSSSSSSLPSGSSQGLGPAPGTAWQFSPSNTTPPPLPAGQSNGSWKWVSGPSGGYYWSFIPAPKQDLPSAPGTTWQFSQSNSVAPPLPAGSSSGTWKWISAPSGGGYYWSFIAGPKQNLPTPPGTPWIFSTSSITAPPLPAGVSASGTWKWVSSPDGKGCFWSFIPSGKQPASQQPLPDPPTGGSRWIFSTSSTSPPPLPAGASASGSWKWVSAPNGNGFYWSYISSPQSPQQQLPPPQSGSTEWIFSPSKTTPPALPAGISGTAGSWKWVSAPNGNGYYWSFTPSSQKLPAPKPGSTGWVFSSSNKEPPTISGVSGPGSWTWIYSQSENGYYWSWTPGALQNIPAGFQGGFVTPDSGTTGQQGQGYKPSTGTGGSFDTKPGFNTGGQGSNPDTGVGGSFDTNPGSQGGGYGPTQPDQSSGGVPLQPGQPLTGGFDQVKPDTGGPGYGPGYGGNTPQDGSQPQTVNQGQGPIKGPFGGIFDQSGKPVTGDVPNQGGDVPQASQPQTGDQGQVPIKGPFGGSFDQSGKPITGDGPSQGGEITQSGGQPQTGDQGQIPIKGPFGGSFDQTGIPIDTTGQQGIGGVPSQPTTGDQPSTNPTAQGQQPIKGPFGGSFDQTGRPIEGGGSGNTPIQQPGQTGGIPSQIPQTGGDGIIKGPSGGGFDQTGQPFETTKPIEGGGSTSGSHESGGIPVQQPGETGETPLNPDGSRPSSGGEDVIKGPFGGSFDSTGKPVDVTTGSQGTYKCPPRSRIELLDAPTVPEAVCPNSQDRRYVAGPDKSFYILCCRHVDGGKKEITVVPDVPSLQYCIHICAGTPNCKSVLYTARQGHNSKYPVNSCQLFEHGDYDVQTPCNNDAHDSAYLIESPTSTDGEAYPIPSIAIDPPYPPPPVSTPEGQPPQPPSTGDVPPSFIMLPPGISEQCVQNVFAAIRCGTCAAC
ncbi:hypothetical protein BKA64DRAFT_750524 [Cadophora sp. MPI-SDFR-AT-0126]|nr:hypothetical protein BKA64DRAFT_750524 [Leotiomycetes sp. MPI-SDFR-AT-0126]